MHEQRDGNELEVARGLLNLWLVASICLCVVEPHGGDLEEKTQGCD